jgi:hypothetical protein
MASERTLTASTVTLTASARYFQVISLHVYCYQ